MESNTSKDQLEILGLQHTPFKVNHRRLIAIAVILIVVNCIVYPTQYKVGVKDMLYSNLVGFNILALLMASVFNLIPYRELPYRKKYFRTVLIIIIVMQVCESLSLISVMVMKLLGLY